MQFCYSPSTNLFYQRAFNPGIPDDAVDVPIEMPSICAGYETAPGPDGQPRVIGENALRFLQERIAEKRWKVETGGMTLPDGIKVDTAREDQAAIANTLAVWPFTGLQQISFKAASGFVILTETELQGIAGAIGLFKQACYEAERLHCLQIAGLSDAELLAYDFSTGWPGEEPPAEEPQEPSEGELPGEQPPEQEPETDPATDPAGEGD